MMAIAATFSTLLILLLLFTLVRYLTERFVVTGLRATTTAIALPLGLIIGSVLPFSWHLAKPDVSDGLPTQTLAGTSEPCTSSAPFKQTAPFKIQATSKLIASLDSLSVNGATPVRLTQGMQVHPDDCLELVGWARNPQSGGIAGKIVLLIDGNPRVDCSHTVFPRPDVAKFFHDPKLVRSSYSAVLSGKQLGPGRHSIGLAVAPPGSSQGYRYTADATISVN